MFFHLTGDLANMTMGFVTKQKNSIIRIDILYIYFDTGSGLILMPIL